RAPGPRRARRGGGGRGHGPPPRGVLRRQGRTRGALAHRRQAALRRVAAALHGRQPGALHGRAPADIYRKARPAPPRRRTGGEGQRMSNADAYVQPLHTFVVEEFLEGQGEDLDRDSPLLELGIIDSFSLAELVS